MTANNIPSNDPSAILFLQSANKRCCAKRFTVKGGKVEVVDYDDEIRWNALVDRVDGIDGLGAVLQQAATAGDMIAIVGELIDETVREGIPRRMYGAGAALRPSSRRWLAIDIDKAFAEGETPKDRVAAVIRDRMPKCLHGVRCWYQLTSSYGVAAGFDEIRARLWYWLDEPVQTDALRQWAKQHHEVMDPSIYVAVQPIYIAFPRFKGVPDPVPGERFGFIDGPATEVRVVDMDLEEAKRAAARHSRAGQIVARKDVEPNEAQIRARIDAIGGQISKDSRHFHAEGIICELYGLGCDIPTIAEVAEEAMVRNGRDPRQGEIEELIARAARIDAEGRLKTNHLPLNSVLSETWEDQARREEEEGGETGEELLDKLSQAKAEPLTSANPDGLNAQLFLRIRYPEGGFIRWAEQDWEYTGRHWERLENKETLKHRVDQMGGVSLSEGKAKSCVAKIRGLCGKEKLELPGWISQQTSGSHAIVLRNGMLFVDDAIMEPKSALLPHTMDYFATYSLPFDYDPDARCPRWESCVEEWFKGDRQSMREFQKVFGYLLVPDNRYEKFFVFTDSNGRAGKGTAIRVLEWLLGDEAVGATSFSGFAKDFGLGSMLGKSVILFNEANAQAQADVPPPAIDRLKSITGNDRIEVERKGIDSVYARLKARIVMSCNRMPNFRDPSGALMKRMHLLEFKNTFFGREDDTLKQVGGPLFKELAGIFNWCLKGLEMLNYEDKRFIRPDAADEIFRQAGRIAAPMRAFAQDCLVSCAPAAGSVDKDTLYAVYVAWFTEQEGMQHPLPREKFAAEIRHLFPHRVESRPRAGESRSRRLHGILFSPEGEAIAKKHTFAKDA